MNETGIPEPVAQRNTIPATTALIHTMIPVGNDVVGRRHPPLINQPSSAPTTNGHIVATIPSSAFASS